MINKKILYIAKYADVDKQIMDNNIIEDVVYAEYHKDFYNILKNNFENVITATTPDIIFKDHTEYDYVASLLNRMPFSNSEIFISSLLEYYSKPYLGAGPNIRATAEDKQLAKLVAYHAGIKTADWITYNISLPIQKPPFEPPYFVKPRFGASSLGVDETSVCFSWDEAKIQINSMFKLTNQVIVEQYIQGQAYTCPILSNFGDTLYLPPIRECSSLMGNVITYKQKRKIIGGLTREIVTDERIIKQLNDACSSIFKFIQPIDYTRMDFIIDKNGTPYFIEFNVCCNLGKQAAINLSAQSIGISYENLICNIITSSMRKQNVIYDATRYKF